MLKPINLTFDRRIRASIGTVWACLTEAELIAQWFFAVDFRPVVGHRFQVKGEKVTGWRGWTDVEVVEISAPHRMVWLFDCVEDAPPGRVVFSLEDEPGFVRFTLNHTGFVPLRTRQLLDAGWKEYTERLVLLAADDAAIVKRA